MIIETITRETVKRAFDVNFNACFKQKLLVASLEVKESLLNEKKAGREALLHALGFTDPSIQEVQLTPRFKGYDYLIDTSQMLPNESAQILSGL